MPLTVESAPRVSPICFVDVLRSAGSPAANVAEQCYQAIAAYGLDPAVGLAFFQHESNFGKAGAARYTCNWGNIRAAGRWLSHHDGDNGTWLVYLQRISEGPRDYWVRSSADWAQLIRELYINRWHLQTVEEMLLRYAPTEDQNDPRSYAACVKASVERWAQLYPVVPLPTPVTRAEFDALEARVAALEAGQ